MKKKGPTKRAKHATQGGRSASSSGSEAVAQPNAKVLCRKDGRAVTVDDFLADVELIKAGEKPKLIEIGLERTEFQKLENETKE